MWPYLDVIIAGLPWTLALTGEAFLVGALLGLPVMLARESRYALLRLVARVFINIVRSIPPIVWLFIIYFGMGNAGFIALNPFAAAVIGLGLISSAHLAEIYRGGVISVLKGQREAAEALNLGVVYGFVDVIAPQALRVVIPSAASYAIGLLKDSATASAIGVAELTDRANQFSQETLSGLQIYAIIALVYILVSLPVAWISRTVDSKLRSRVSR